MTPTQEFALASRAFGLFTQAQQLAALTKLASLRYPSVADRFIEAVHSVIVAVEGEAARPSEMPEGKR